MKRPIETALWCDCETTHERIEFLKSGRAWEVGIIAKAIIPEAVAAFEALKREEEARNREKVEKR